MNNASGPDDAPQFERLDGTCPACGASVDATRRDGRWRIGSLSTRCPGGGECLRAIAAAVGAPGGGALLDDPVRWLSALDMRDRRAAPPAPVPSPQKVQEWHQRLAAEPDVMAYLLTERGLTTETLRANRIGYDGQAITLPVYRRRQLVNLKRRYWPDPAGPDGKGRPVVKLGLRGRGSQLYPRLPRTQYVCLVAGEFDALLLRQHGIDAITSTSGASLPEHMAPHFFGRTVAVIYDEGEEAAATRTVSRLLGHGARRAWVVSLGLPNESDDLTDWFVTYKKSSDELRALINRSRPRRVRWAA